MKRTNTFKIAITYFMLFVTLMSNGFCQAQRIRNHNDSIADLLNVARQYKTPKNGNPDYVKARNYFIEAAKLNSPEAFNALGIMSLKGEGDSVDVKKAYTLFLMAARMHSAEAYYNLGKMHYRGVGVPADYTKAFSLYLLAANGKYRPAYYEAGNMLYKGYGVQQDYATAITFFQKGDSLGDKRCRYMLGCCNLYGYGMAQNRKTAQKQFEDVAAKGHKLAQGALQRGSIDSVIAHPPKKMKDLPDVKRKRLKEGKMQVASLCTVSDSLYGRWTGKLYTYDWSRTSIENEQDMTLELSQKGQCMQGNWYIDGRLKATFEAQLIENGWAINHLNETDSVQPTDFWLKGIRCGTQQGGTVPLMTGNFLLISKQDNDPTRPTRFILDKETAGRDTTFYISRLYPNPFMQRIQVEFTVKQADCIGFRLLDGAGNCYYTGGSHWYQPGVYSLTLQPRVPQGSYTLVASGQKFAWYKHVIKQ